ncbi:MAG: hypothetical protein KA354_13695 [Phycisphaerae bacterium]|nr:hypothetical protein [Phycisphaerae bacterium]
MRRSNGKGEPFSRSCLWGVCIGFVALAVAPAWAAPSFSYSTDFESDADGATPAGWVVTNSGNDIVWVGTSNDPKVMTADPAGWASISAVANGLGAVNYAVPWSGTRRFTILHPGWSYDVAFASGATFTGTGATYSGTYPMDLQNNKMKAAFDLAMRTGRTGTSTHGFSFTVQPVENTQTVRIVGLPYGREGYDQNGFGVEVDVYNNTGGGNSGSGDQDNKHVGINLYRMWDNNGSFSGLGITVPSLKTNVDQGVTVPFPNPNGNAANSAWCAVGNNNQPLHFTVYYNDPDKGGLGVVRVYLKVDPATKANGDPQVPAGQTAFSFGYDVGDDPVDGKLMVEAYVGPWPSTGAAFGFSAARSGSTHLSQVDNVHVETNAVTGTATDPVTYPPGSPTFDPGTATATLPVSERVQTGTAGLTQPGWEVSSYIVYPATSVGTLTTVLDVFKGSIRSQRDSGFTLGTKTGEPNLNYYTAGASGGGLAGNFGEDRLPPGMSLNLTWIGILAKGWIYFPSGNKDYDLCMNSDNGYEIRIGNTIVSYSPADGTFSSGLNGGSHFTLHVDEAGVYPIQILWFDWGGGAYMEFYRRTDSPMIPYLMVGNTTWGIADQPVVFGLRNGAAAPDYVDSYTATPPVLPDVALSPTQKAGDTSVVDGQPTGFNIKTVWVRYPGGLSNTTGIIMKQNGGDGDVRQTCLGFLDALDNLVPGTTSQVINYRGVGEGDGNIGGGVDFPGIGTSGAGQYGLRAEGYLVFPTAGRYLLGANADDDMYVRFGEQTVLTSPCCRNLILSLSVSEPGVYPVRVECIGDGPPNFIDFYELSPTATGYTYVSVNSTLSTVKAYQSIAGGAYAWTSETNKWNIPADRKVATLSDVQDADLGWNATLVKSAANTDNNMGLTAALVQGDLVGLNSSAYPRATDTPFSINYADNGQAPQGNFNASATAPQNTPDRLISSFLADSGPLLTAGDNDDYVISFQGYAAFSVSGYYAFNTNCDDGSIVWVAGKPVAYFNINSGAGDNTPGFFYVQEPGVYDIRMDYFERNGNSEVELLQYLPDGITAALINDPNQNPSPKRVKVYRALKTTPLTTEYADPGQLPLNSKVGDINRHGDPGARIQFANATFINGDYEYGIGHDKYRTLFAAHELLASVLDNVPSLNYTGALALDQVFDTVVFPEATFPAGVGPNAFAMRATGLLALTKGGHIFEVPSDDGFRIWIGGKTPGESGPNHGVYYVTFYVNAPEDGLYPFTLEYNQGVGGYAVSFDEVLPNEAGDGFVRIPVNTENAAKMYVGLTSCAYPSVDADADGDVDQMDFGVFQACFSGDTIAYTGSVCKCFDKDGDTDVDPMDFTEFLKCVTGPTITWSELLKPECQP